MSLYVHEFQDVDKTKLPQVGGKGAKLREISKVEAVQLPDGLCISTKAFKDIVCTSPSFEKQLDRLSLLRREDRNEIRVMSGEIRRSIEESAIPECLQEERALHLSRLGEANAYAVRSSATAEDLPTASFAGQLDNLACHSKRSASIRSCF